MDDNSNILLPRGTGWEPKDAPYARASFGVAVVIIAALLLSPFAHFLAYAHLLFPFAIVFGHLALRKIKKQPGKFKGQGMAKFGLAVGYFNLFVAVVLTALIVRAIL